MENIRIIFISTPKEDASSMARQLVEKRLAACVNIIPKIESHYWWDGKIESDEESLLIVKTSQQKVELLMEFVKEEHPYDIPEIITFPVAEGLPAYINWVLEETGRKVT